MPPLLRVTRVILGYAQQCWSSMCYITDPPLAFVKLAHGVHSLIKHAEITYWKLNSGDGWRTRESGAHEGDISNDGHGERERGQLETTTTTVAESEHITISFLLHLPTIIPHAWKLHHRLIFKLCALQSPHLLVYVCSSFSNLDF
ncbi:uncharacterized protein LOC124706075 isoform X2 [Lolium rigidum]|nr:uncharacterized protein LOC124706075 isoform X2 [Lolium rigidum]